MRVVHYTKHTFVFLLEFALVVDAKCNYNLILAIQSLFVEIFEVYVDIPDCFVMF